MLKQSLVTEGVMEVVSAVSVMNQGDSMDKNLSVLLLDAAMTVMWD